MRHSRDDRGYRRIATIDIETTHFEPARGETVSIGLAVHDRGTPSSTVTYELFHRDGDGERALIERAMEHLDGLDADVLVSYGGRGFDVEFLRERSANLGGTFRSPALDTPDTHVDLFEARKAIANRRGRKWPKLEESLESYGCTPATTVWGESTVTNVRFGEELGPEYLETVKADDADRLSGLIDVIEHYLTSDLEANLTLYYADIGEEFSPRHLGNVSTFDA